MKEKKPIKNSYKDLEKIESDAYNKWVDKHIERMSKKHKKKREKEAKKNKKKD